VSGAVLGVLALALLAQAGLVWMRSIRELRTGERRLFVLLAVVLAVGLGVLGLASRPGLAGGLAAGLAVAAGTLFLLLQALGGQSRAVPAVAVGGPMLDFTAPDAEGRPFRLASLHGRPYLLKFFRGHW
jgi:cytochrome oxidase Cu insertion factor (SCO1/SenC/PrrC family)